MVYCCFFPFSLFSPRGRVQPLVGITDYTVSTFPSDYIINIYHYFIQDPYRTNCAESGYLSILFQHNGSISLLPWCIVFNHFLVLSSRMRANTCWDNQFHHKYFPDRFFYCCVSLFCSWPLSAQLYGVTFSSYFISSQWCHITVAMDYFCFCRFSLFAPFWRVQPLVGIIDYIGSNFLSNHIISI